jgi:DNA-binding NarL/FixJ family response regulator
LFVVDDHALVRQGLTQLLNSRLGLSVIGEAETAAQGVELVRKRQPDLVILDLSLAQKRWVELVKQLKTEFPNLLMLVMSMHDEAIYATRVLRAGARGYVMKKEPSDKIFDTIEQILRGEIAVSDRLKREILEHTVIGRLDGAEVPSIVDGLSDRELEVFRSMGEGISTREIAARLHLSVKTIESYREHLKVKLNLRSGAELVRRAVQWGKSQTI